MMKELIKQEGIKRDSLPIALQANWRKLLMLWLAAYIVMFIGLVISTDYLHSDAFIPFLILLPPVVMSVGMWLCAREKRQRQ
jgi:hypothetical protein